MHESYIANLLASKLPDEPLPATAPDWAFKYTDGRVTIQLSDGEQLALYGLVAALCPRRLLEIGFFCGGSSLLMLGAMESNSSMQPDSHLVSLECNPTYIPDSLRDNKRFTLLRETSPAGIPKAVDLLGGPLDFAFIDANHYELEADLYGVWPHLSADGHILMHDTHFPDCQTAIANFCASTNVVYMPIYNERVQTNEFGGFGLIRRRECF